MKYIFKEKHIDLFIRALYVIILFYMIFFPSDSASSALEGFSLFYKSLLPVLLPFFILSSFSVNCGIENDMGKFFGIIPRLLGISSGEYTYTISLLSGYPTSTKAVTEGYLRNRITKRDATVLLILASNGSAPFIISFIGQNLLADKTAGMILLLVNYLSPFIAAKILSKTLPEEKAFTGKDHSRERMSFVSGFVSAVRESVSSVLNVGAFIVFFSVIASMAEKFSGGNELMKLIFSPLELTNGCSTIAQINIPMPLKTGIMSFIIGFGGVSVTFQNLSFIEKTDLDKTLFVKYKLITGAISFIISYTLATIFAVRNTAAFYPMDYNADILYGELNLLLLGGMIIIILYTLTDRKTERKNENK